MRPPCVRAEQCAVPRAVQIHAMENKFSKKSCIWFQVKLYEAIETEIKVYLVLELAEGGDLLEFINNKNAVDEDEARSLFCQILATMAYCHKESVVHRDLKCENILLDDKGRIKITGNDGRVVCVKQKNGFLPFASN